MPPEMVGSADGPGAVTTEGILRAIVGFATRLTGSDAVEIEALAAGAATVRLTELGLSSLTAVRRGFHVQQEFGVTLTASDLLDARRITRIVVDRALPARAAARR